MGNSNSSESFGPNASESKGYPVYSAAIVLTVGTLLIFAIVFGNLLVITAAVRDRKLKAMRQNWLVMSLAVADLLVGALIMPLSLAYEVLGTWAMGMWLCEIWLALDVLFVTSSILNLCVISIDRYWSITDPLNYPAKRTPRRMALLVAISWVIAFAISFPPLVGWRPKGRKPGDCTLSTDVGYVLYSASGSFYIPVTVLLLVYLQIYKISKERSSQKIKEIIKKEAQLSRLSHPNFEGQTKPAQSFRAKSLLGVTTVAVGENGEANGRGVSFRRKIEQEEETVNSASLGEEEEEEGEDGEESEEVGEEESGVFSSPSASQQFDGLSPSITGLDSDTSTPTPGRSTSLHLSPTLSLGHKQKQRSLSQQQSNQASKSNSKVLFYSQEFQLRIIKNHEQKKVLKRKTTRKRQSVFNPQKQLYLRLKQLKKKERRATLILGLILLSFVMCWLPFFVTYLLGAAGIPAPEVVFDIFFWAGYCNSAVNPLIYTVFNPDFRNAFIRLLCSSKLNTASRGLR